MSLDNPIKYFFLFQLQKFVKETLSILKPELVMCGGDLTEAKSKALVADQDLSEWTEYRNIVDSRWNNVTWLDIRNQNKTVSSMRLPVFALNVNHKKVVKKRQN